MSKAWLPVKTLGLPDDYAALDGWGRRIMYAVDRRMTASDVLTINFSTPTLNGNTSNGSKTINNFSSTLGLTIGSSVTGSGIPVGATIATIPNSTTITINVNATATAVSVPITFCNSTTKGLIPICNTAPPHDGQ